MKMDLALIVLPGRSLLHLEAIKFGILPFEFRKSRNSSSLDVNQVVKLVGATEHFHTLQLRDENS